MGSSVTERGGLREVERSWSCGIAVGDRLWVMKEFVDGWDLRDGCQWQVRQVVWVCSICDEVYESAVSVTRTVMMVWVRTDIIGIIDSEDECQNGHKGMGSMHEDSNKHKEAWGQWAWMDMAVSLRLIVVAYGWAAGSEQLYSISKH